jgi:hypothetical protein
MDVLFVLLIKKRKSTARSYAFEKRNFTDSRRRNSVWKKALPRQDVANTRPKQSLGTVPKLFGLSL